MASSKDRWDELKRNVSIGKGFGFDVHLVSPNEITDMCPIINTEKVIGALYVPTDGHADPASLTHALAKGAKMYGAEFMTDTEVTGFSKKNNTITEIHTNKGKIKSDIIVNAGGLWARRVGALMGVNVPVYNVQH